MQFPVTPRASVQCISDRGAGRLMDDKEYDELLSRKLWHEADSKNDLLEFDFGS